MRRKCPTGHLIARTALFPDGVFETQTHCPENWAVRAEELTALEELESSLTSGNLGNFVIPAESGNLGLEATWFLCVPEIRAWIRPVPSAHSRLAPWDDPITGRQRLDSRVRGCRKTMRTRKLGPSSPRRRLWQNTVNPAFGLSQKSVMPAKAAVAKVRHAREGGHPCECVGLHKVVAAWPPGCRRQTRVEELGAPMNAWLRKIGRRTRRRLRGLATLMDSRVRGNDAQARASTIHSFATAAKSGDDGVL
jgi:hypothetical protein